MIKAPERFKEVEFKTDENEILAGIISDTQTTAKVQDLPEEIGAILKNVNLIIHAGDIERLEFMQKLERIAPFFGVKGNMDFGEIQKSLPAGLLLKVYNWKIGVVHSPLSFWSGVHFNQVQEVVAEKLAKKEGLDILIFGHTHHPYLKEIETDNKNILLFNPGSAMSPFIFSDKASVGILKISKDYFKAEIIPFKSKEI